MLLCAYASTLPSTLTDGDAGEFLTIAKTGGIAHPPGYPLFILIARALTLGDRFLPLVTLVAAFSALCVAAAGGLLVRTLARLTDVRASAFGVTLACLTPEIWRQANAAEPFGLNLLLASVVIAAGVRLLTIPLDRAPPQVLANAAMMSFAFGLGFANHHTLALLVPLPVMALVRWRHAGKALARATGTAVVAFLLGSTPILTLFAVDRSAPLVYGDVGALSLVRHALRLDYGVLKLSAVHSEYGESLWHFTRGFLSHTFWIGPLLLLLVLFGILQKSVLRSNSSAWWSVAACTLLTGPVFLALMNIPPDAEPVVVARFFALPMLLIAPWLAVGAQVLFDFTRRYARVIMRTLVLVVIGQGFTARRVSNRATEQVYEAHIRQMLGLAGRPASPVIVSASDLEDYGLAYGQHVLRLAPQAIVVMLGPFSAPWYRARLAESLGLGAIPAEGFVPLLDLINSQAPLFVVDTPEEPRPALFARARPLGGLSVVIPPAATMPTWVDLYASNGEVLSELPIVPAAERTSPLSGWETRLIIQHRDSWFEVCRGLRNDNRELEANACNQRGRIFDEAIARLGTMKW